MQVRNWADVFEVQRRVYAIQDWRLPFPIGLTQLTVTVAVAIVWVPVAIAIGVPAVMDLFGRYAAGMTAIGLGGPPAAAGWAAGRPLVEGRTVAQHLYAAVRSKLAPQMLVRMARPPKQGRPSQYVARTWLPTRQEQR